MAGREGAGKKLKSFFFFFLLGLGSQKQSSIPGDPSRLLSSNLDMAIPIP